MDFPKTIGDNNMKINIIFYSFLFFLFSCKVEKDSNCNVLLRKAKENLNSFYNKNDADYLIASKIYLDSINCNSFSFIDGVLLIIQTFEKSSFETTAVL